MPGNSKRGLQNILGAVLKILPVKPDGFMDTAEVHRILTDPNGDYQFKVSLRSVQRYLVQLGPELDCRESTSSSNSKCYRRVKSTPPDQVSMSVTDALTLKLIESSLRPLLPTTLLKALEPRLKEATYLLDTVRTKNPVSDWPNKVASVMPMVPFVAPEIDPKVLQDVQNSLIEDWVIDCEYRSIDSGRFNKRRLHPLGLVQRGEVTYLVATIDGHAKPLPFALHRMRKTANSVAPLRRPPGFTLAQFVADQGMGFGASEHIRLKMRLSSQLKTVLAETRLDRDQVVSSQADADGWHQLEANVILNWQLEWWLLSKLEHLEVLEPVTLRASIAEKLKAANRRYGKRP